MTSWAGNRGFAPLKKKEEAISYFQPTEDGICSNMNRLFYAYVQAAKISDPLYVHDTPNCIGPEFPMFERILRDNSTIKYLKRVPDGSRQLKLSDIENQQTISSIPFQRLKQLARDFYFYNGDTQGKILETIQSAGLARTLFDIGVHIRTGDKPRVAIKEYINAIRTFGSRIGKTSLNIFVMTDNINAYTQLKNASPSNWTFTTLQEPSFYTANGHTPAGFAALSEEKRQQLFYAFLTDLHLLQNIPNIVVSFSSSIGRFLYLTNRLITSKENCISVDVPEWRAF